MLATQRCGGQAAAARRSAAHLAPAAPCRGARLVRMAGGPSDNPFADDGKAGAGPSTSGSGSSAEREQQLEQLEASIRGKRTSTSPPAPRKQIPIRGVTQAKPESDAASNMSEWKEGQLFPEGWDRMPLPEKLTELYMGRRGFIFWLNKAAYASVFVLLGGWVAFRFIGPALGLYRLQGDLLPPTL